MTTRKFIQIQKDSLEATILNNSRPITCLHTMWKIPTALIREEISDTFVSCGLFRKNRKCATREQNEQVIYCTLICTSSRRAKMSPWPRGLTAKKTFDVVPQSWITAYRQNVQDIWVSHKFNQRSHEIVIDNRRENIHRGENPGGYLPRKCIYTITICNSNDDTQSLREKCIGSDKFTKSKEKINHLMYMDDIKLFAKNWKRIGDSSTNNKNTRSRYWDRIWHRKCAILIMRSRKGQITEGIELLNQ